MAAFRASGGWHGQYLRYLRQRVLELLLRFWQLGYSPLRGSSNSGPVRPQNWLELNAGDVDLGSMGPTLLQGGLIFQAGKEGKGCLLRAASLGHIGGEVFSGPVGQGAYGGTTYAPPYVFAPCTNGLVALRIDASPSFKVAWSRPGFFAGPPVVVGGTVLTVDIGSDTVYGFTVDKGDVLFKVSLGPVVHFTTPALSGGRIFEAANRQIVSLGP